MLREGNVVLSKCSTCGQIFGITMERQDGVWRCLWAFKISEKSANAEGYDSEIVSGAVVVDDEYPGCPYCGKKGWTSCCSCKGVTCSEATLGAKLTCGWCGMTGVTQAAESFDLRGGGR